MLFSNQSAIVIEIIIGISTIIAVMAGSIKWLTKHYFDEIRSELKPNSGSSLKDQVTRLETKITEADELRKGMDRKIDKMFETLLTHISKTEK
jgi:hypothetical protein